MVSATITYNRTTHHIKTIVARTEKELLEKAGKLIIRQENPKPVNTIVHVEVNDVEINFDQE